MQQLSVQGSNLLIKITELNLLTCVGILGIQYTAQKVVEEKPCLNNLCSVRRKKKLDSRQCILPDSNSVHVTERDTAKIINASICCKVTFSPVSQLQTLVVVWGSQ
uniref:Uncharacterized protein n=1 Tax=Micrurus spixii TaxID=129469 RepID=A0A2D4MWZ3_9SAUR